MLNDLFFLVFSFEFVLLLNTSLILYSISPARRLEAARLILKTSLPLTIMLLSGSVFLTAAIGSTDLTAIYRHLISLSNQQTIPETYSLASLGILLIVMGCIFRMGAVPVNFRQRSLLDEAPHWLATFTTLIPLNAGLCFLLAFVNQVGTIHSSDLEQILYFGALIILTVSAGLLLVEKQLQRLFELLIIQTTGIFLALLSAICWRWRHATGNPDSGSILQTIQEYTPELLLSYLTVTGLAFLVDGLSQHPAEIRDQSQLQGLISDQRLAGGVAVVLLLTLIGFPGLAVFRLKWQTLLLLLEIHQPSMTGTMATVHTGYLGLAIVLTVSSVLTAFVCTRLLVLVCFARPLTRHRRIAHRGMIIACYCCVLGLLIFSLKMLINF